MEDADDLNQSRLDRPIIEHVYWVSHLGARSSDTRMAHVKAAKSVQKFVPGMGKRAFRIGCDCSQRGGQ